MNIDTKPELEIEATIIRKNGKKENLGKIYSSNKLINFFIQIRMKLVKLF